jgi:hypothetical protein
LIALPVHHTAYDVDEVVSILLEETTDVIDPRTRFTDQVVGLAFLQFRIAFADLRHRKEADVRNMSCIVFILLTDVDDMQRLTCL